MARQDPRFIFYGITDQASGLGRDDAAIARELIAGGITCLQYRAKKVSAREQWMTAQVLRQMTQQAGIPLIINDRVDLALACGADAVHLGQDDLPLAVAKELCRRQGKALILGKSTHSLEQARAAQAEGADYIGYGPLYLTQTKENNVAPLGLQELPWVLKALEIPVVAIGGIKKDKLTQIAQAGARHCAVVTALTAAAHIASATREIRQTWDAARAAAEPQPIR